MTLLGQFYYNDTLQYVLISQLTAIRLEYLVLASVSGFFSVIHSPCPGMPHSRQIKGHLPGNDRSGELFTC